jgi:hypothetical protein
MSAEFQQLVQEYTTKPEKADTRHAQVDKYGPVPGSISLFNPFNIFRYSRYGMNPGEYRQDLHSDRTSPSSADAAALAGVSTAVSAATGAGGVDPSVATSQNSEAINNSYKKIKDFRKEYIENPTASKIIEWSRLRSKPGEITADGPVPYSNSDFIWCKFYGKIPNNRLITLRRYPIPVEDNLNIAASKMPLVPMAQAVTWFDKSVGNNLNTILKPSWGLKWTSRSVKDIQDIQGNEVTVEEAIAALGQGDLDPKVVATIKALITGETGVDYAKLSGFDKTIQDYVKGAYGDGGPYWNRILGPLNVINGTAIRDRGFNEMKTPITLKFVYSLRSWGGVNPKIAFLDLLGNFLSLTYSTAPFWGGGARYFERTGVTLPSLGMEQKFFEGDIFGGVQQGMKELMDLATSRFSTIVESAKDLVARNKGREAGDTRDFTDTELDAEGFKAKKELDKNAVVSSIEKAFIPRLALLMQKPLLFRSILDGRAVGEWHLTIGNPMNPIANIGNLICTGCDYELSDTLGLDDFPTEVTFTISLQHARTRAKQDIESMFNAGNGAMTFSELPLPSSAYNSLGDRNTATLNSALNGTTPEGELTRANSNPNIQYGRDNNGFEETNFNAPSGGKAVYGKTSAEGQGSQIIAGGSNTSSDISSKVATYSRQVRTMYGDGFGNPDGILTDYFKELKTKD